ncbi:DUF3352 domain-containing protein [Oscillochloris sp. ZM17-4]|uniref:DUF3352 domain-containing protein n=1 Tax=Oscillochloris sp. ZM17-4 TaxID=2866714 RepID=UPI001C72CA86|nr:DUF3352 domain-containing protein [Oscillochloris sp. ZM17-4]MBX0329965.1 DUF3352 domain-containing protein [Oscillochloris sp. ZM17-4]
MSNPSLTGAPAAPRPERGLGFALLGGLGITLIAVLIGAAYWLWLSTAQRSASPAELLAADTQLYVSLAPSLGDMPEGQQIASVLRDQIGVGDPGRVLDSAVNLLGVDYNNNLMTWIGGTMVVSVRGLDVQGEATADRLLREGEVVFLIGSRNDPQAEAFIEKHLAARAARGDVITSFQVGEATVYAQEGGAPSPIAAFTLFEHYLIFSNRPEAITAMIGRLSSADQSLAAVPSFAQFREGLTARVPGGRYTVAGDASQVALAALRELLMRLDT